MANVKLPKSLDPVKSAQKRASYNGVYLKGDLQRLCEAVTEVTSDAQVKVEFAKDAQGLTYFQGQAEISVVLTCQRSNRAFAHEVTTAFCFSPVQGMGDAEFLPEKYEPIEVDTQGAVDLFQLIEDELILSLPVVPFHPDEDNTVVVNEIQFGESVESAERPNPFAVLKELKRD
ncbi:MAG: 23S rRNA accumulation protein YceD [Pseudomonadota bacterium]